MDPVSASFTSGIGATLKILEVLYQIQATDEQTSDILNTANHVDRNLNEAQRLLEMKASFIDHKDKEWVISTIQDTREALKSISKLIEPARVEKMTKNDIGILAKTFWAFKYNPQARDKQAKLVICHQTLMVVISRLHSINIPIVSEAPYSESLPLPPPYDQNMEKLWAWQDHRNSRKKSTMSLRNDFQRGPVVLATNQRQATEGPPQTLHSYSTTNYMIDSRRGHLAQDIRTYNTSYHPNHSHNEASGQSPHHLSSTAPTSRDEWIYGSQTNVILQRSEARLPRANTTSPYPIHAPHGHSPAAEDDTSPYEMSAAQTSPPERHLPSHLTTHELAATPRKPIDHPLITFSSDSPTSNSDYNNGMSIHQPFPNSATRSNLTSPSWSSLVSVKESHHPPITAGYELAEQTDFSSHPLNVLDNHSELEAEAVQGDAVVADAGTSEKSSLTYMWASGDDPCSISSHDLTKLRSGVGDGVRNNMDRYIAAGGTRRRTWLGYQSSLRNSRHGREGIGEI